MSFQMAEAMPIQRNKEKTRVKIFSFNYISSVLVAPCFPQNVTYDPTHQKIAQSCFRELVIPVQWGQ